MEKKQKNRIINSYDIFENTDIANVNVSSAFMDLIKKSKPKYVTYQTNLKQYQIRIIQELKFYFQGINEIDHLLLLMNQKQLLLKLYKIIKIKIDQVKRSKNIENIQEIYATSINIIQDTFKIIEEEYRYICMIPKSYEKDSINYNCSIKKLFIQLEELTYQYVSLEIPEIKRIKKLVKNIIRKYKDDKNYEILKLYINKIGDEYVQKIYENPQNIQNLLLEMQNKIYISLIKYQENCEKISLLNLNNKDYKLLKDNILSPVFEQLYEIIITKKNLKDFKDENEKIISLYQNLKNKISNYVSLKKANNLFYVSKLEKYILTLFNKAKNGLIEIKSLELIKEISLENPLSDIKILQAIENNMHFIPQNNLYIKKAFNYCYVATLKYLKNEFVMSYIDENGNIVNETLDLEIINNDYILLEKVLYESSYIGPKSFYDSTILYIYKEYIIYLDNYGQIKITLGIENIKTIGFVNEVFKNRKFLQSIIISQLEQELIENDIIKKRV